MLCDYQPHPVRRCVFPLAGLLRGYSDAPRSASPTVPRAMCPQAGSRRRFPTVPLCFAWWGWQSIGKPVGAWLLSLLVCALVRAAALAVLLGLRIPSVQLSALFEGRWQSLPLTLSMLC